jgi:hypothetical protein
MTSGVWFSILLPLPWRILHSAPFFLVLCSPVSFSFILVTDLQRFSQFNSQLSPQQDASE